ncbi:MAG TPA: DUF5658 family protein [Vicinamibacterales bacterium]
MVRFARSQCVGALFVVLGCSVPTAAQELVAVTTDAIAAVTAQAPAPAPLANPPWAGAVSEGRPGALIPLYASFVTLQVLDLHSTAYALDRGAAEANPAIKGFVDNTVAMSALKAAGTAGVIFISERLRTKNKAAALGLMIASNAAMTWVVQHNYRATR